MVEYEVVVVGCGPAGSLALGKCAELGLRAVGLEACKMPRSKPCAGVLYPRVLEDFDVPTSSISARLRGVRIVAPSGNEALVEFEEPGAVVRRDLFDYALAKRAVAQGATIVDGTKVARVEVEKGGCAVLLDNGGVVKAKFVIAADGAASTVARALGKQWKETELALAVQAELEVPEEEKRRIEGIFEVYYDSKRTPGGWAWVVGRRDCVLAGLGYPLAYASSPREFGEKLRSFLAWRFRSFRVAGLESHPIPIAGPRPKEELVSTGRVLFAGDAGGFVRKDTGEGVYYAMLSGVAAAEAVYACHSDPEDLAEDYYRALEEYGLHQLYTPTELAEVLLDDREIEKFVERLRKLCEWH